MISKYKAIIFDWDGTLVDSTEWVLAAHNHVRKTMGMALWTMEDIFGSSSFSTRELYPKIYGENAEKAMNLLFHYTDKYNLEGAIPYSQAEDLLKLLHKNGKVLAVVSNKRHEPLNKMIDHLEWRQYFSSSIGAGFAERDKPHPSSLLMAINQINESLNSKDILYIGDTETDLLLAQNVGCDVVLVQSDKPRPDLISKYNPTYSCNNISNLIDLIEGKETAEIKAC